MTSLVDEMTDDAIPCAPNISAAGRRRRERFGAQWAGISVAALGAGVLLRARWGVRALVLIPAALSAIGFLQARRSTCVMRAREGTFEHDDFSTENAPDSEVVVSRKVAAGINRDALLIGIGAGAVAAATVLIR
jgi:hypothetical protein